MIVTIVHVLVAEDHIQDFIRATIENHNESIKEPGNLRFDILRDATDPAKFVLYEAYESEEASAAHKNTPHYLKWRETVQDMMAEPRKGIRYTILQPKTRAK